MCKYLTEKKILTDKHDLCINSKMILIFMEEGTYKQEVHG